MTGHIVSGGEGRFLVRLAREQVLGLPLLRGEAPGSGFTARRVRRTARALRRRGVTRALAPEGFPFWEEAAAQGLRPVETGELCRALAAPIALAALAAEGVPLRRATVALRGERVTRRLWEAALTLCPVVRQLLVEVPAGGEDLRRTLRREFGLPAVEGAAGQRTDLTLCFSTPSGAAGGRVADLSGDAPALPEYRFGLAEGDLPPDAAALPLLSALWSAGRLAAGSVAVTAHFALDRPGETTYNTE